MRTSSAVTDNYRWGLKVETTIHVFQSCYSALYVCTTICSNDDPGKTLLSNVVPYAFVWEKGKTMDISETIVVYDIKVGRCS